jgi:hypothetical protein
MKTPRDLRADEIDLRIQQAKENGLILLYYKDARVDMDILDETFGPMNWQRHHEFKNGKLYCAVSVWDEQKGQWITKEDVGTESNTEADKGQASDAFKRACVNFGSGRELYTAPFTWIRAEECNIKESKDRNGKTVYKCNDKFRVEKIVIENKEITAVAIRNDTTGKRVFVWQKSGSAKAQVIKRGECLNAAEYDGFIGYGDREGQVNG